LSAADRQWQITHYGVSRQVALLWRRPGESVRHAPPPYRLSLFCWLSPSSQACSDCIA